MLKSCIRKSIFAICIFHGVTLGFAQNTDNHWSENMSNAVCINVESASRLAIDNNFDIQLIQYDTLISRTRRDASGSVYDTIASADMSYAKDKLARTSTLASEVEYNSDYNVGLSKKVPTGTTLGLDYNNQRISSGASYVTVNPSHESSLSASVTQELGRNFFGLQDRGSIKVTEIEVENAQYTSLERIEQQVVNVQKAYWDLVLQTERVAIVGEFLEEARKLFELNQDKLKDGRIEEPDFLDAQANYEARKNDLLLAENLLVTKENTLRLLLNIASQNQKIMPCDNFNLNTSDMLEVESLQKSFAQRYDYRRARRDIDAKKIELSMKKNSLWPVIDVEASYQRNGIDGESFSSATQDATEKDDYEFSVGVNFETSLEKTQERADYKAARYQKAKAITALKYLERSIAIDVIDSVRNCNVLKAVALNQQAIAQVQQDKLNAELKKFLSGRSDTNTIIRFQEDVISARWQAAQAKMDYQLALIDLRQVEGDVLRPYFNSEDDVFNGVTY